MKLRCFLSIPCPRPATAQTTAPEPSRAAPADQFGRSTSMGSATVTALAIAISPGSATGPATSSPPRSRR